MLFLKNLLNITNLNIFMTLMKSVLEASQKSIVQFGSIFKYIMVIKYADSGNLRNYLKENFENITWNDKFNLAFQLVYAVSYLHGEMIVHRDFVINLQFIMIVFYFMSIIYFNLILLFIMLNN